MDHTISWLFSINSVSDQLKWRACERVKKTKIRPLTTCFYSITLHLISVVAVYGNSNIPKTTSFYPLIMMHEQAIHSQWNFEMSICMWFAHAHDAWELHKYTSLQRPIAVHFMYSKWWMSLTKITLFNNISKRCTKWCSFNYFFIPI